MPTKISEKPNLSAFTAQLSERAQIVMTIIIKAIKITEHIFAKGTLNSLFMPGSLFRRMGTERITKKYIINPKGSNKLSNCLYLPKAIPNTKSETIVWNISALYAVLNFSWMSLRWDIN